MIKNEQQLELNPRSLGFEATIATIMLLPPFAFCLINFYFRQESERKFIFSFLSFPPLSSDVPSGLNEYDNVWALQSFVHKCSPPSSGEQKRLNHTSWHNEESTFGSSQRESFFLFWSRKRTFLERTMNSGPSLFFYNFKLLPLTELISASSCPRQHT